MCKRFKKHSSLAVSTNRSSCSQMFGEIVVLIKDFAIFTGIHLCWSLFVCFPVDFAFDIASFVEHPIYSIFKM